jgi:predicted DNA-binding WGR domain protein
MRLLRQTFLAYQEGNSDKVYEVDLCEVGADSYVVNFRYGKRGGNLKEGTKTKSPVNLSKAEAVFDKLVGGKQKKGYTTTREVTGGEEPETLVTEQEPIDEGPRLTWASPWTESQSAATAAPTTEAAPAASESTAQITCISAADYLAHYAKAHPETPSFAKAWSLPSVALRAAELQVKEAAAHFETLLTGASNRTNYAIAEALGSLKTPEAAEVLGRQEFSLQTVVGRRLAESCRQQGGALWKTTSTAISTPLQEELGDGWNDAKAITSALEKNLVYDEDHWLLYALFLLDAHRPARQALLRLLSTIKVTRKAIGLLRELNQAATHRQDRVVRAVVSERLREEKLPYSRKGRNGIRSELW